MTDTMLVRTSTGGWEELRPHAEVPDGGIIELFGEDIGPVLGSSTPVVVAASAPELPTGRPDAICVDAAGAVTVVTLGLAGARDDTLASLLSYAGALHGMGYEPFERLCERVGGGDEGLAGFIASRSRHADFHRGTFEVTVADALAHGRFRLVALVAGAPDTLVQSMRYLNASGANVALYEAHTYASSSVMAVQARALDVGQPVQQQPALSEMTAAGLLAITERTCDELTARLMGQLQKFCAASFDDVRYEGDSTKAAMSAVLHGPQGDAVILTADSDGSVVLSFEGLAPFDPHWTVRAELCQAMSRLLGADLGEVKKISQLNLSIAEHLMDATLMEALIEILSDTISIVRSGDGVAERAVAAA